MAYQRKFDAIYRKLPCVNICKTILELLWSSDALWRHRSGSSLAQFHKKAVGRFLTGNHEFKVNIKIPYIWITHAREQVVPAKQTIFLLPLNCVRLQVVWNQLVFNGKSPVKPYSAIALAERNWTFEHIAGEFWFKTVEFLPNWI